MLFGLADEPALVSESCDPKQARNRLKENSFECYSLAEHTHRHHGAIARRPGLLLAQTPVARDLTPLSQLI